MFNDKFSISKRLKSFKYAFEGLKVLVIEEHNARVHLVASILVIIAGFCFSITIVEWIALVLSIGFVFSMEAINSSIESISYFISPEKHDTIKKIKDL